MLHITFIRIYRKCWRFLRIHLSFNWNCISCLLGLINIQYEINFNPVSHVCSPDYYCLLFHFIIHFIRMNTYSWTVACDWDLEIPKMSPNTVTIIYIWRFPWYCALDLNLLLNKDCSKNNIKWWFNVGHHYSSYIRIKNTFVFAFNSKLNNIIYKWNFCVFSKRFVFVSPFLLHNNNNNNNSQ